MKIMFGKQIVYLVLIASMAQSRLTCACENSITLLSPEILLLRAVQKGDTQICRILLQSGVDPKKSVKDGILDIELLPLAAAAGFYEICELLIAYGAVLEARGCGGYTALHYAAEKRDYRLCKLLIEKGAQVDCTIPEDNGSCSNFTPLCFAALKGELDLCKLFILYGANINHQAVFWCWKKSPLDYAAENGHLEVCKLLVEMGAQTRADFSYGSQEIRDYVAMAYELNQVYKKKLPLKYFTEKYLDESCQKKNVLDITGLLFFVCGIQSEFFKQVWDLYDADLKNYFFLAFDFESVKKGTMTVVDYSKKHLNTKNFKKNVSPVADLVISSKNTQLAEAFMGVFAKKPEI